MMTFICLKVYLSTSCYSFDFILFFWLGVLKTTFRLWLTLNLLLAPEKSSRTNKMPKILDINYFPSRRSHHMSVDEVLSRPQSSWVPRWMKHGPGTTTLVTSVATTWCSQLDSSPHSISFSKAHSLACLLDYHFHDQRLVALVHPRTWRTSRQALLMWVCHLRNSL